MRYERAYMLKESVLSATQAADQISQVLKRGYELLRVVPLENYRNAALCICSVWLLLLLADIFWALMPQGAGHSLSSAAPVNSTSRSSSTAEAVTVDIAKLQAWQIFGALGEKAESAEEEAVTSTENVNEDAEETRLSLRLLGVIESNAEGGGYAIIEYQSQSDLYKVGQEIPAGKSVSLSKVLSDRVIIDNRGQYESVFLYDEQGKRIIKPAAKKKTAQSRNRTVDQRNNPELTKMAAHYRQQLLNNPMSLAEVIKISMAKDASGNLIGYRIRPGRDRKQFADFGLQSGDVVTAINGIELNDPSKAMQIYQQLRSTTEATFAVQRGNENISLVVGVGEN